MSNTNKSTTIDSGQVLKLVYDKVAEALRFTMVNTEIAIELSHLDGDSVSTPDSNSLDQASAVLNETNVATQAAITTQACKGSKSFQLFIEAISKAGALTAGDFTLSLQFSPSDSGAFFEQTTLTLPASAVGNIVKTSIVSLLAKRVKVVITANNLVAGDSVKVYLLAGSN